MNILEKEIEDLIWQGLLADVTILRKRGLDICPYSTYTRQLQLGNYGRSDIIGFNPGENDKEWGRIIKITIIEIKKECINTSTLLQAMRYGKAIREMFYKEELNYQMEFKFVLIGKEIDTSGDFIYTSELIDNVAYYTYQLDLLQGLTFKSQYGYTLRENGFSNERTISNILKKNLREKFWAKQYKAPELKHDFDF